MTSAMLLLTGCGQSTQQETSADAGPKIEYEDVDIQHIKPRPRVYDVDKEETKA